MTSPQHNTAQLIESALTGDTDAESALYEHLFVRFTFIAKRTVGEDAEDLAQEACITVLEKYKKAVFHKSPAAWAHQVLKNKIGNYLQRPKVKQNQTDSLDAEESREVAGSGSVDPVLERDLVACLRKMTQKNAHYSRVMNLRFQGFTTDEICRRVGIKAKNMYVILNRGRQMMDHCLKTGRI